MTDRNEAAERRLYSAERRLYSAFSRQWTIEIGRTVNPDGTVTTENVTVEATVEAIKAAERRATVERIREAAAAVESAAGFVDEWIEASKWHAVEAILDEEAAR